MAFSSFLRFTIVILGGSSGIFWLYKLGLIVLTRFEPWYVVGTPLGHIPDPSNCVLGFLIASLSKTFSEAQNSDISGFQWIFWLLKLRLIVLARFDTYYVVGTLLGHIPDPQKVCVMGFHRDPKRTFFGILASVKHENQETNTRNRPHPSVVIP